MIISRKKKGGPLEFVVHKKLLSEYFRKKALEEHVLMTSGVMGVWHTLEVTVKLEYAVGDTSRGHILL